MILKDIKDIKDIVACVADAFDNIDDLGCDSEGLFEYIKDCNEDFTDRSRLGDRYCYSYAFLLEADKRNVELPIYQKKKMETDVNKLKTEYQEYYEIIKDLC